jgi:redox-sensitive bicupin YhaK (pirin superfamily)
MDILGWILEGELQHRDSLGTGSVIRPGEVQIMSAGTGVQHGEFNPSPLVVARRQVPPNTPTSSSRTSSPGLSRAGASATTCSRR